MLTFRARSQAWGRLDRLIAAVLSVIESVGSKSSLALQALV